MVDFKGAHYPKSVILFAVFFYLRYPVSYRDLEEIMEKCGVDVDHATLKALSQTFELLDGHQMLQNTSRETSMRVERNGD